jgi:hypothetical protein
MFDLSNYRDFTGDDWWLKPVTEASARLDTLQTAVTTSATSCATPRASEALKSSKCLNGTSHK